MVEGHRHLGAGTRRPELFLDSYAPDKNSSQASILSLKRRGSAAARVLRICLVKESFRSLEALAYEARSTRSIV